MKAIKTQVFYPEMIEMMKSTLVIAWFNISQKNGVTHSKNQEKEFEKEIEWFFERSIDFTLYCLPLIEDVISKMVDEQIDWKSEKLYLWKEIAIKTAAQNECWQIAVENANSVVESFENKFQKN